MWGAIDAGGLGVGGAAPTAPLGAGSPALVVPVVENPGCGGHVVVSEDAEVGGGGPFGLAAASIAAITFSRTVLFVSNVLGSLLNTMGVQRLKGCFGQQG